MAKTPDKLEGRMKITLTSCCASPRGVARPGTVLDVTQREADELFSSRSARPYDKERDAKRPQGFAKPPDKFE